MTRETALAALQSGSPHERLRAARYFAHNPGVEDLAIIRRARLGETDSYVKTTLDMVISRLTGLPGEGKEESSSESDLNDDTIRKIRNQVTEEITGVLLHEVASPIGLIASAAAREFPGYEKSDTKQYIENAQRIFGAIQDLKGATTTPRPEEFDLAEFLLRIVAEVNVDTGVDVSSQGPRPLMVKTDSRLLRFAVCNGLRNAMEAVVQFKTDNPHPVVITWGKTDVDCWITIIDRGPGIAGPVEPAFEIGKSSKPGHSGFGLAIARQAMETLNGTVNLSLANGGGVRYELRWGQ